MYSKYILLMLLSLPFGYAAEQAFVNWDDSSGDYTPFQKGTSGSTQEASQVKFSGLKHEFVREKGNKIRLVIVGQVEAFLPCPVEGNTGNISVCQMEGSACEQKIEVSGKMVDIEIAVLEKNLLKDEKLESTKQAVGLAFVTHTAGSARNGLAKFSSRFRLQYEIPQSKISSVVSNKGAKLYCRLTLGKTTQETDSAKATNE